MGKLGGGALGAKRILRDVLGVEMEVSNRGAGRRSDPHDAEALAAFEDMELPEYRRVAPTKRSP